MAQRFQFYSLTLLPLVKVEGSSSEVEMLPYDIILSEQTLQLLIKYKSDLISKHIEPGDYLNDQFTSFMDKELDKLTDAEFLQYILWTKKIICFAESEISGDGSDWNSTELRILGDISVAMSVQVFDNGVWGVHERTFKTHDPPMNAKLIFTPGHLLHGSRFHTITPDLEDILVCGQIDQDKYNNLMRRRLLPCLLYAEETAKQENKKALIVLPGLGCGQFAGKFKGKMGEHLNQALQAILKQTNFENISCVRFDPFNECTDMEQELNHVKYRVRKNIGCFGKPQLSAVEEYEETVGEFKNCTLYKIVAWDHASLPGNDYFKSSRSTDDGVTAAATNSMEVLTGVRGSYCEPGYFKPPAGFRNWWSVASTSRTRLMVQGNVRVARENTLVQLHQ